jgi:predicted RNA-binding protein with PUA-like domain
MAAKKKAAKPKARTTTKKSAKAKKPVKAKKAAPETSQFATPDGGPWGECFLPRTNGERRYWLVKSEPETFSWNDLLASPNRTTRWDGVRNFAARNFLRDGMRVGDPVFFYHSSSEPPCIVGQCVVSHAAYPDPTAFDPAHPGFDESSSPATPTWFVVDLRAVEPLAHPVTLARMKQTKALSRMALLRIGRLSVTPVTKAEWDAILALSRG